MKVIFDTRNSYYLPQYLPVYYELIKRGHIVRFVCYQNNDERSKVEPLLKKLELKVQWVDGDDQAREFYLAQAADWVLYGNGISYANELHQVSRSAQLGHGIGPKPSYYRKSGRPMTVRFIEGELRLRIIQQMYPQDSFVQVGYSKLDPLINGLEAGLDFVALGLDSSKPSILYAPTFNPSSLERFPDDWPSSFLNYNILIKPHSYTYTRNDYAGQRRKLVKWSRYKNVAVAGEDEVSLLPYMKDADILLSEASSTLFEFVALDKPVIVCDFFKLKWFYRGPFRYRFERRFGKDNVVYKDIGRHIQSFKELPGAIADELAHPENFHRQRLEYTRDHVGPMDGKASLRIVDYLESETD
jgi:hypothetical protein